MATAADVAVNKDEFVRGSSDMSRLQNNHVSGE